MRHRIKRMQIPRQDPDLQNVTCLAVAGVQRRNRDDRLYIQWERHFMRHAAMSMLTSLHHTRIPLLGDVK